MKPAQSKADKAEKLLQWLCDRNQEDRRVTIGCKTCGESHNLLAATAMTAWLGRHRDHDVWMRNPFSRRSA